MIHMFLWRNHDVFYAYTRSWARFVLKISRVKVTLLGAENIKSSERYVYIANHASLFDIPVLAACIPDNIRIMYKREL
ncbi:MAG: 1-acyl-sn-glycerol-3-phosphate acyltransferase, partial [Candidatus Kapabacteria bacterium]|nr:1-acyl-sn-glycerol-3-phosphate acyltransferase [Candidatus Kapabacteria bacterium]